MNNKSMRLTTSQFAELHHLNKRTLHFYDSIGLFSPRRKGENNYRYYDYAQGMELEYILMLKELDMSIEEIKDYQKKPGAESFSRLADEKLSEIDKEIRQLKRTKEILRQKKQMLALCEEARDGQIAIVSRKEDYLFTTPFSFQDDDLEMAWSQLKQTWGPEEYRMGYGSYISVEKARASRFDEYAGLFVPGRKKTGKGQLLVRPAGSYLLGYCVGDWDRLPLLYDRFFGFAAENGLELTGYAFEMGLNEFAISSMDEYVTQVLIQIRE